MNTKQSPRLAAGFRVEPTEAGSFHLVTPHGTRVTFQTRVEAEDALDNLRCNCPHLPGHEPGCRFFRA